MLHAPVVTGAEEPAARIKNRASLFEQRCEIFELDADREEALWALDQSRHSLDCHAMLRDTLALFWNNFRLLAPDSENTSPGAHPTLQSLEASIRRKLDPREAYNMVPGKDPKNR